MVKVYGTDELIEKYKKENNGNFFEE